MISTIEKLNEDQERDEESEMKIVGSNNETLELVANNAELDINDIMDEISSLSRVHHRRCGVHTLQLAIRDGLADKHAATLISKIREIVVAARKPKIEEIIKRRAGKVAILDQATRWGSTYMMIERLLELKSVLIDMVNPEVTLSEVMWDQVKKLKNLLYQPYITTKKIQGEDLTPGQFLKEWKSLIYCLSKTEGTIAEGIKASMEKRENRLLENDVMLAGVYLDPKYRCLLTDKQQSIAKEAVYNIAVRMRNLRAYPGEGNENIPSSSSSTTTSDTDLDFEKVLDKQHGAKAKRSRLEFEKDVPPVAPLSALTRFKLEVWESFAEVEKFNRQSKMSVQDALVKYPEIIRDLAQVVIALPTTQVSVERLFSALKIIKSDLRAIMKDDLIEAILFLRTNCYT